MANDVTMTIPPGERVEAVAITVAADTALATISVVFSTSTFPTKESFVKAAHEIVDYAEGIVWPPVAKPSSP